MRVVSAPAERERHVRHIVGGLFKAQPRTDPAASSSGFRASITLVVDVPRLVISDVRETLVDQRAGDVDELGPAADLQHSPDRWPNRRRNFSAAALAAVTPGQDLGGSP